LRDVTDLFHKYRECARGIWNNFLRENADFQSDDAFSVIREQLFHEIVLRAVDKREYRQTNPDDPFPFLHLVPVTDTVPIMINRPSQDGNQYWDEPINRVPQQGTTLLFIDYFDWDRSDFMDFQYYRVRVSSFDKYPHLAGRDALLDVHNARALFD
jgi:hypothetical protein